MNKMILIGGIVATVLVSTAGSTAALFADLGEFAPVEIRDENGDLVLSQVVDPGNPLLLRTDHYFLLGGSAPSEDEAKPGGGGGGNDCPSSAYKLAGWHWTKPWSAKATDYASTLNGGASAWDQQAGGSSISGGVSGGSDGTAGVQDFKNNIAWVNLGASSTVAVTSTWAYRGSGEAVESDARYNTYYPWSTSGASNAMDVGHVGTHEIGHTFGLGHPSGSGIDCLTMYAYVNYGVTIGRTLGNGDILGIKAIYG